MSKIFTPTVAVLGLVLLGLVLLGMGACSKSEASEGTTAAPTTQPTSRPMAAGDLLKDPNYDLYGAGVRNGEASPVEAVLANPSAFEGKPVRLTGTIDSVCKKKGCWMRVGDPDSYVFVKFQDYGFFMPLDSEGREAIMEGVLTVKKVPLDEAKHYLEDEGKHAEAAALTEAPTEVTFMATGVALKQR